MDINTIYNEDCLVTLDKMPNNFLDLTVTSPPYNVDLGNNKYNKESYNLYNDNKEHQEYINWLKSIFSKIYNKTKSSGRCIINIGDGRNGAVPTHSDIIQFMTKEIGWKLMTIIIWNKSNIGNRTSWGSFNSPSSPSFPTPFEYILVFCRDTNKLLEKGETDLYKEDFIKWSLALWEFNGDTDKTNPHPASFPEELPKRCIQMFSYKGALVYDPFSGSGTTAVVAKKLGRNYIGSEISKEYIDIAKGRLAQNTFIL
jgi:site-specific DNA-methyltransferase (adenine-specific)